MEEHKTEIISYAGMRESMGAVFSIVCGKDRVIMDFGSAFDPEQTGYIKKDGNWILDKLNKGILPPIEGLYPGKYLRKSGLRGYQDCDYSSAVFVSHLHLDHMSNIGAVDANVPVYMSENARKLEYALEDMGKGVDTIGRSYSVFENRTPVQVGKIKVIPIMNSPYSYNMYGFLIETPDLKVGYTADLSLSYECPEMVHREMEIFRDKKVNILYCDNCNFNDRSLIRFFGSADPEKIVPSDEIPEGMVSFDEHYRYIESLFKGNKGLVVFNHYEREMLDVQKIMQWAAEEGRTRVFEPEAAYLVYKFFNSNVSVYLNGYHSDEPWFTELMKSRTEVSREDVMKAPYRYYLHNSFKNINELFNLRSEDGLYIHADGDPFSSKEIALMKKTVREAGFRFASYDTDDYYQHGYPNMVKYFVDVIDPDVVIGYHGRNPERLMAKNGYNLVPEKGVPYVFENGKMIKKDR